ncbi:MAG: NAD(P)H-binding protein [Ktedonobacterales bacterium]|nr:NAD(P)H-binding protein [Ktedonobacterales bacterium]
MYAVSGASGQLGRLVLKHLLTLVPAQQIVATTRTLHTIADVAASGIAVRQADFTDPRSLPTAFADVTRLLLISTPGQRAEEHTTAIAAAVRAGVTHIIYTSGINASPTSPALVQQVHGVTEAALAATSLPWTALRNSYYAEFLPRFIDLLQEGKVVHLPPGQAGVAWVTREDCARTAAFVLAGTADLRGPLDVTGPEAVSLAEVIHRWSGITGRAVTIDILPDEHVRAFVMAKGLPASFATSMVDIAIWANREGFAVTNTVEQITGRPPAPIEVVLTQATS